jgi:hypothetical protein
VSVSTVIHTSFRPTDAPGLFDCSPAMVESPAPGRGAVRRGSSGNAADRNSARRVGAARPAIKKRGQGTMHTQTERGRRDVSSLPPIPQAARDLLADAARGLGRAIRATDAADRYATAHLAALRAAAALLAARARPVRGRRGSAWELMAKVAPEFSEWAAFFAAGSATRQAAEAGIHRLVSAREADDMVRQVAAFLELVDTALIDTALIDTELTNTGLDAAGQDQRRTF